MTAGNLRTEPTVNCVAVSNPPLPGQTACATGTPSLANGTVDQLTTEAEQWAGLPVSQQGAAFDPSGFLQPIANSTTTVSVKPNSSSMTVSVTGAASGGPQETLLAWVLMLPVAAAIQQPIQYHLPISRKPCDGRGLSPSGPGNNTTNGIYNLGTLYGVCAASTAQCLVVEFNLPGAGANGLCQITFSKGFTHSDHQSLDLCGAEITSVFAHGLYDDEPARLPQRRCSAQP